MFAAPLQDNQQQGGNAEQRGGEEELGVAGLLHHRHGFGGPRRGQADLSAFQIRIYTDPGQGAIPGMTIEVKDNEFNQR